jgi:putative transposase
VSIRRACRVLLVDTSTYHYKPHRRGQADIEKRIKEICETRIRYGYRRVHVLLRREGWMINMKRTRRIYAELGLQLRNKTPKRRVKAKLREDRSPAAMPNETWAMDFVHDQLATGKRLRVLTVVDIFSKFSPAVDPRFSYRAEDVVLTLERVCGIVGYPRTIRVDQVLSSSRAISICGPIQRASSWTSADLESQRTMHLSKHSTASSERSV